MEKDKPTTVDEQGSLEIDYIDRHALELERQINSSIEYLTRSLRVIDDEGQHAKATVLHDRAEVERHLADSAHAIVETIEEKLTQERSNVINHVTILQEMADRVKATRGMPDNEEKQKLIRKMRKYFNTADHSQHLSTVSLKFEQSAELKKLLAGRLTLGTIKYQLNTRPVHTKGTGNQNNLYHVIDCNPDWPQTTNNLGHATHRTYNTEECRYSDLSFDYRNISFSTILEDSKRAGSKSEAIFVSDYSLPLKGEFKQSTENSDSNVSLSTSSSDNSSLGPGKCLKINNDFEQESSEAQHKGSTRSQSALEFNLTGCGFMYRDEWLPNIVHRPTRSIEELSCDCESCNSSNSANTSLSDNCAYPASVDKGHITNRKRTKIRNTNQAARGNPFTSNTGANHSKNEAERSDTNPTPRKVLSCTFSTSFETKQHRTPCVIPDIAWLPENWIVLADHYHNNIQLFDRSFRFVTEEPCAYPMGVCMVDRDRVAVSLRRAGSVSIFQVEHVRLKLVDTINVKCEYYIWNVVYKSSRLYVMCDENNIHVMDLTGRHYDLIHSGIPTECGYVRYFDVSDDGRMVYLCTERGLICINESGEQIWEFTKDNVPDSKTDKFGRVLESVCYYGGRLLASQWTQSVIFEISLDGEYIKHLITTGLEHPRAMVTRNGQLAVTQFNPLLKESKKRTVKIFGLRLE